MKYLVKIDRDSIVKNPRAGQTTTVYPQKPVYTFECRGDLPEEFTPDKIVIYETISWGNGISEDLTTYKGEIIDDSLISVTASHLVVNVEREMDTLIHPPIPKYAFKYLSTDIECIDCSHPMKHEELQADSTIGNYSNEICPKCGSWDCVELEYENINTIEI